jgi:hypothetical protein
MNTTTIIIVLAGIFGGFVIGIVTGFLAGKRSAPPAGKDQSGMLKTPSAVGETDKPERTYAGFHPLFRVLRKKDNGKLAFELDDRVYADPAGLSADARAILEKTGREWLAWLGAEAGAQPAADAAPAKPAAELDFERAVEVQKAAKEQAQKGHRSESIPAQIDVILQDKLKEMGLADQNIRIGEDQNRAVVFYVGTKRFSVLDEIDDPQALRLIKEAIADWEATATLANRR